MGRDTTRKARDKRIREPAKTAEFIRDFENPRREDDAHEWANDQYERFVGDFSDEEMNALYKYQRGDMMYDNQYDDMYFRGVPQSEIHRSNENMIRQLGVNDNDFNDEGSNRAFIYEHLIGMTKKISIAEGVYLYRGEKASSPVFKGLESGNIGIGDTIRRGNFNSTSLVKDARFYELNDVSVRIKIKAPKGSKMLYVDTLVGDTWQYEMILPPRTGLKITNITKVMKFTGEATYELEAEIIDDGSKA